MNPLSLVWDTLFVDSSITDKKTSRKMISSMGEYVVVPVRDIMNWNTVMKGQKTSGAGFTSGLRFVIDVSEDSASSIIMLANRLLSFEDELCAKSSVSLAEKLPIPLDRKTRKSFPEIGRLMLSVRFTHGLGYDDAKKIKNAMGTQTKETKDGLNPIGTGKGSSGSRFSEEFRSMMSDPYWFRTFPVGGREWDKVRVTGGADGGVYELGFDLRKGVNGLVKASEGIWWEKLDPDELTLSPTLVVDCSEKLNFPFDPSNYFHLKQDFGFGPQARLKQLICPNCQHDCRDSDGERCPECGRSKILIENLINNVLEIEEEQTGNAEMKEELSYTLGRITRGRRIPRQMGDEQGLVHGLEEGVIGRNFIMPWLADEFVNCLGFFLMTRKPKYWRNGESKILLVRPYSEELVESLKGEY